MKILADENIDRPVVEKLRGKDIDIAYVEEEIKGANDENVLRKAKAEDRIIVTFDSDFLTLETDHPGVIRITRPDRYDTIVRLIIELLETFSKEDFRNTVVEVSPSEFNE